MYDFTIMYFIIQIQKETKRVEKEILINIKEYIKKIY